MARLARPCAAVAPAARAAARSSARSSTSSGATTSSTSPMARASSARTWRPVKIRSLARAGPTSRASRWVPPPPGMMPEQDLGLTEAGLLAGDAEVAGQGQLAAAAEGEAGDGRDGGPRDVGHRVEGAEEELPDAARPRRG